MDFQQCGVEAQGHSSSRRFCRRARSNRWVFIHVTRSLSWNFTTKLDAHAHIIENGYMNQLPLMGSSSVQGIYAVIYRANANFVFLEVIDRIKAYLRSHPDILDDKTRWIEGMGWDQTKWPGAHFPTAVSSLFFASQPKFNSFSQGRPRYRSCTPRTADIVESSRRTRSMGVSSCPFTHAQSA